MAWTEPSDWLKADLRNSISVDSNSSLRSINWTDRQIRNKNAGIQVEWHRYSMWLNTLRIDQCGAAAFLWCSLESQCFTRMDVFFNRMQQCTRALRLSQHVVFRSFVGLSLINQLIERYPTQVKYLGYTTLYQNWKSLFDGRWNVFKKISSPVQF